MRKEELEKKSETEGLTAEEVTEYQRLVKPVRHVYGKYGTMKKKYLEGLSIQMDIIKLKSE